MSLTELLDLPTGILIALGILVVVELTLLVIGVIAWTRTPDDRMPPPNRWAWLALVALVQIFGPVAFLLARRSHERRFGTAPGGEAQTGGEAIRRSAGSTADLLYGRREDTR